MPSSFEDTVVSAGVASRHTRAATTSSNSASGAKRTARLMNIASAIRAGAARSHTCPSNATAPPSAISAPPAQISVTNGFHHKRSCHAPDGSGLPITVYSWPSPKVRIAASLVSVGGSVK